LKLDLTANFRDLISTQDTKTMKLQYIITKEEYDHIQSLTHGMEVIMRVLKTSPMFDHNMPTQDVIHDMIERERMLTAKLKEVAV
jgi:hypothetical protein